MTGEWMPCPDDCDSGVKVIDPVVPEIETCSTCNGRGGFVTQERFVKSSSGNDDAQKKKERYRQVMVK